MVEETVQQQHKGALAEHRAIAWLLDRGYDVFRNVSAHGPVDIIAMRDAEILLLDAKTLKEGKLLHPDKKLTAEQRKLGVKLVLVTPEDCMIGGGPIGVRVCPHCSSCFRPRRQTATFCSQRCADLFRTQGVSYRTPSVARSPITCAFCGKQVSIPKTNQLYCTKGCQRRAWWAKQPPDRYQRR